MKEAFALHEVATVVLPAGAPMFAGHFPGQPIIPGAYLLALVQQHADIWLAQAGAGARVNGVASVKFTRALGPAEPFAIAVGEPAAGRLRFRLSSSGTVCASGTLTLGASTTAA